MMERLTTHDEYDHGALSFAKEADGRAIDTNMILEHLAAYEDTGLTPDEVDQIRRASQTMMFPTVGDFVRYAIQNFEDLEKYRKAESEGRLIVLPCKVGDTIYVPVEKCKGGINVCPYEGGYGTYRCDGNKNCGAYVKERRFSIRDYQDIGKTAFLAREEAEAALKEET